MSCAETRVVSSTAVPRASNKNYLEARGVRLDSALVGNSAEFRQKRCSVQGQGTRRRRLDSSD
eukprot:1194917-Prorocentrum_minimum.AAC.8